MKPVTMTIAGGLGNQLFQYAAGYAFAKDSGRELQLDVSFYGIGKPNGDTTRQLLLTKFNIPEFAQPVEETPKTIAETVLEQKTVAVDNLKTIIKKMPLVAKTARFVRNKVKPKTAELPVDRYIQQTYHLDDDFVLNENITTLIGQFQTENYFKKYEADIRQFYMLKDPLSDIGQSSLKQIKDQPLSVSIHVRRGDYAQNKAYQAIYGLITIEHYKRAIEMIKKLHGDNAHFFIFSDDPALVTEEFNFLGNKTIMIGDTDFPHEDLYLMSQCKHHIIANSTFSWWGAWLNPNKDKTVIAPRWWVTRQTMKTQNTMDIYPEGWLQI
jgi:hypothetical protein